LRILFKKSGTNSVSTVMRKTLAIVTVSDGAVPKMLTVIARMCRSVSTDELALHEYKL
jgi:hypothetical protein